MMSQRKDFGNWKSYMPFLGLLGLALVLRLLLISFTNYDTDVFYLVVRSYSTSWLTSDEIENQRYALTVTLEHVNPDVHLYNQVQLYVRQPQRVRVRA